MDKDNLYPYDHIATHIFWEGSRNFTSRSKHEQNFLTSFFDKYQILVLTEKTYKNKDQLNRIKEIVARNVTLSGEVKGENIEDIHSKAEELFNKDLSIIMGNDKVIPDKWSTNIQTAVMAMIRTPSVDRQQLPAIRKRVNSVMDRKETESVRQELFGGRTDSNVQNLREMVAAGMDELYRRQSESFIEQAKHFENVKFQGTQTAMDGQNVIQGMERMDSKLSQILQNSEAGRKWENVTWKEVLTVKWLSKSIVNGVKNTAIYAVAIPLYYGPKAVVTETVIVPLKLVIKDVISLKEVIQRIWGWAMIGFCIAGVWVLVSDPDYEQQRTEWYDRYNTAIEYIPVDVLMEPTRKTIQIVFTSIPGKVFFGKVAVVIGNFVKNSLFSVMAWFQGAIAVVFSTIKDTMIAAVASWWSGK